MHKNTNDYNLDEHHFKHICLSYNLQQMFNLFFNICKIVVTVCFLCVCCFDLCVVVVFIGVCFPTPPLKMTDIVKPRPTCQPATYCQVLGVSAAAV